MNDVNRISSFSRDDAVKLILKCLVDCIENNPIVMEITNLMEVYGYYKENPDCKEDNPEPNSCVEALIYIIARVEHLFGVNFADIDSLELELQLKESESQEVYQKRLDEKYDEVISFIENLEIDEEKVLDADSIQDLDYLEGWISSDFSELHNGGASCDVQEVVFYNSVNKTGGIPNDAKELFKIGTDELLTPDFKIKYLKSVTSELKYLKEGILESKTKTQDAVKKVEKIL